MDQGPGPWQYSGSAFRSARVAGTTCVAAGEAWRGGATLTAGREVACRDAAQVHCRTR